VRIIRVSLLAHGACHEQIHMFHTRLTSESFVQLISPIFPSLVTLSNLHDHSRQTHQTHISELIPITNVKTWSSTTVTTLFFIFPSSFMILNCMVYHLCLFYIRTISISPFYPHYRQKQVFSRNVIFTQYISSLRVISFCYFQSTWPIQFFSVIIYHTQATHLFNFPIVIHFMFSNHNVITHSHFFTNFKIFISTYGCVHEHVVGQRSRTLLCTCSHTYIIFHPDNFFLT